MPTSKQQVSARLLDEPKLAKDIAADAELPVKEVRTILEELVADGKAFKVGSGYASKAKAAKAPGNTGGVGDPRRHAEALARDETVLAEIVKAKGIGITKAELAEAASITEKLAYMSIWRLSHANDGENPKIVKFTGGSRQPRWVTFGTTPIIPPKPEPVAAAS